MQYRTTPPQFWGLTNNYKAEPSKTVRKPQPQSQAQAQPQPQQTVNEALKQKVLNLVNGDKDICNRLISSARTRFSGKDESWYWEKVYSDLIRDRA
ncbi:hypothetical protein [Nostoc sp. MS1]|uniref:hypothetical protein n=1 Tax=Nostoc sp. MS1 TaxID=2764711 RepID=UPI001CC48298|nr:hypothetical protein [Nostoc sp. MS1]BCL34246.1 hypothetical protein NSMS1_06930 [Nostoc sp. MS1]